MRFGKVSTMQHLFLTGNVRVGKSTILRALLARAELPAGGFQTFFGPELPDGGADVYMIGAMEKRDRLRPENVVAHWISRGKFTAYPEAFNRIGAALLKGAESYPFILMDELGFMESQALDFQKAVLSCLNEDIPVLGVVKPLQTPFLERVQNHKNVRLLWTTKENRDRVFQQAFRALPKPGRV